MSNSNSVSFKLDPFEWTPSQPNYILGVTGMVTTGGSFSVNLAVTDSNNNNIGNVVFSGLSGQNSIPFTLFQNTKGNFPWLISGTITSNLPPLNTYTTTQHSLGAKDNNGTPICYEVTIFNNDGGSDNDWNDLVLNFQLFNASTD